MSPLSSTKHFEPQSLTGAHDIRDERKEDDARKLGTGHPGTAEHGAAVIQRRSEPGNGAKTTIRTGLIGIRLEQSQEAGLSGDSGELRFNGNHWETLPCAQSIKMRLMPS